MPNTRRHEYRQYTKCGESRPWNKQLCPVCRYPVRRGRHKEHAECRRKLEQGEVVQ